MALLPPAPSAGASRSGTRRSARARGRRPTGACRRISCAATRPSSVCVGGIRMSTIATSGRVSSHAPKKLVRARPPCRRPASPASPSRRARPSRSSVSSSAITTRTAAPLGSSSCRRGCARDVETAVERADAILEREKVETVRRPRPRPRPRAWCRLCVARTASVPFAARTASATTVYAAVSTDGSNRAVGQARRSASARARPPRARRPLRRARRPRAPPGRCRARGRAAPSIAAPQLRLGPLEPAGTSGCVSRSEAKRQRQCRRAAAARRRGGRARAASARRRPPRRFALATRAAPRAAPAPRPAAARSRAPAAPRRSRPRRAARRRGGRARGRVRRRPVRP